MKQRRNVKNITLKQIKSTLSVEMITQSKFMKAHPSHSCSHPPSQPVYRLIIEQYHPPYRFQIHDIRFWCCIINVGFHSQKYDSRKVLCLVTLHSSLLILKYNSLLFAVYNFSYGGIFIWCCIEITLNLCLIFFQDKNSKSDNTL